MTRLPSHQMAGESGSDANGADAARLLVRQDYLPRYRYLLREHLPEGWAAFGNFFADTTRLRTLARMLRDHFHSGERVLNVGSGPFATEIFVAALQGRSIVSFDYTAEFARFYNLFRDEGLLPSTQFIRANALTVEFEPGSFDLVIMHDILYEAALDIDAMLARHGRFLAPGGLLYLDFMNRRTEWIWRLLGKERQYRRYRVEDVRAMLRRHGFDIVEQAATSGPSTRVSALFHLVLRTVFRTSNTIAILARKNPAGSDA